jgi:hypothetical protein
MGFPVQDDVDAWRSSWSRNRQVGAICSIRHIRVIWKAEELLGLLLLKSMHLVLKHLALKSSLPFMFKPLELNSLKTRY